MTVVILQLKKTYLWSKKLQGETENIELFKGRIIERYGCLRFKKCLLVVLFLSSRALSDGLEVGRLAEMLVLGEQIVEHPQSGLQVQVDNVLRSGFRLRQTSIHHQLKSQADVGNFFVKGLAMKNGLNIHKNRAHGLQ